MEAVISTHLTEREQIEQAILALESQRLSLGDLAVDAAVAGLRQKLESPPLKGSEEHPVAPPAAQRKQLTILFADVSGFTAMSEQLDAEVVGDTMDALWQVLDRSITTHGGVIDKHIGDAVMGLWGAVTVDEKDPENAIRAALEMQSKLSNFSQEYGARLRMRIGLNSGPALVGAIGTTSEVTALGDSVNLASRLEQAAPPGGIIISHDTYRHVRGVFEVVPLEPFTVKGKREAVQAYLVKAAKSHAFRQPTRGIEGVETRTIGREAELLLLRQAFLESTTPPGYPQIITLTGEAGIGKSRLVYELENWIEVQSQPTLYYKGRAIPETLHHPYSLLRDLFRLRFEISESDSAETVRSKLEAGMGDYLELDQVHLAGFLAGFDLSETRAVKNLSSSPSLAPLALAYIEKFFHRQSAEQATVMMLEDLHWADEASLEVIGKLVKGGIGQRMLVVCTARPEFYERQPGWGQGLPMKHLDLKPLSPADSAKLTEEILQKAEAIPEDLRRRVVNYSEGNPYYIEELVRMLMEKGIILLGADRWHISTDGLQELSVPPTLTGILQARLDHLAPDVQVILRRAAVVGRFFWDAAVAALKADSEPPCEVEEGLLGAQSRELIYRREQSVFKGAREYVFKHAVLRDVTYETTLLKARRVYHGQVAAWLEAHSGKRITEYLGQIAEHYARAGKKSEAVDYFVRSGERALQTSAYQSARQYFDEALSLIAEDEIFMGQRIKLLYRIGEADSVLGEFQSARQILENDLDLAKRHGDDLTCVNALNELCWVLVRQGEFEAARSCGYQALKISDRIDDPNAIAMTNRRLGILCAYQGENEAASQYFKESLQLYQAARNPHGISAILNNLGIQAKRAGDHETGAEYHRQAIAMARELGDQVTLAKCLNNLAVVLMEKKEFNSATQLLEEALAIQRELGYQEDSIYSLLTMGEVRRDQGEITQAYQLYQKALGEAMRLNATPMALFALMDLAEIKQLMGELREAIEILAMVQVHPSTDIEARHRSEALLDRLRTSLLPEEFASALELGKKLVLEDVAERLMKRGKVAGEQEGIEPDKE